MASAMREKPGTGAQVVAKARPESSSATRLGVCGTYHLFFATGAKSVQKPDSGDLEELELLLWTPKEVEKAINEKKVKSLGVLSMLMLGLRCLK